jgi:hypothetical protein
MKKVSAPKVVTTPEATQSPLPPQIQEALGELVGAAREGLLALSVGVGLGVVYELMELEVAEVVGPKGKHDPDRTAKRHGHEEGSMTLGGRRVKVDRPRVRTADDEHELPIASYEYFADRDPLTRAVMDRMLAGVSTRKVRRDRRACRRGSRDLEHLYLEVLGPQAGQAAWRCGIGAQAAGRGADRRVRRALPAGVRRLCPRVPGGRARPGRRSDATRSLSCRR